MPEVTIEPTECVWMGSWEDHSEKDWPWHNVVGACWFAKPGYMGGNTHLRPNMDRPAIVVQVPFMHDEDGVLHTTSFCIDAPASSGAGFWDVSVQMDSLVVCQKPMITVHPSINIVNFWHGWLQEGVLHQ